MVVTARMLGLEKKMHECLSGDIGLNASLMVYVWLMCRRETSDGASVDSNVIFKIKVKLIELPLARDGNE